MRCREGSLATGETISLPEIRYTSSWQRLRRRFATGKDRLVPVTGFRGLEWPVM
jgi:hypothetical protein